MSLPTRAGLLHTDSHGIHSVPLTTVEQDALRMAMALETRGVRQEDAVLLIANNSAEYISVLFGLIHIGASIVLADPRQQPDQHRRLAALTGASWAITDALPSAGEADSLADSATPLFLGELRAEAIAGRPDPAAKLSTEAWRARDDALITCSSGTTGAPKAVVRSGRSVWDNVAATRRLLAYRDTDVLLPLLSFSHQYGLSLVLAWWLTGCSLVVAPYVRVDHALEIIAQAGVTAVDTTPSTYHSLLGVLDRRPGLAGRLGSVRMWCVGGAPLGPALANRFQARLGTPLLDGYGSTEAGNIALATPRDPLGCGRPLPGVDVEIRNDNGDPVAPGEIGELRVRSAGLFEGYLAEDGTLVRRNGEWYVTNDLGYRDGDGNLYVLGRKHAVHRLGYTLYPEELARKAEACGRAVAVVALEDDRRGCQLVFVVADPGLRDARYWRRSLGEHLAEYEQPNHVVVVESLPVNGNGKADRLRLERIARDSVPAPSSRVRAGMPAAAASFRERAARLEALHAAVSADPGPVLDILTEISNFRSAQAEIEVALDTLRGAVEEIDTYRPGPVASMAVFMPSNVVFYSYVLQLLVPALFAGEVGFRPSGQVAETTRRLHEVLADIHGLPVTLHQLSQRQFVEGPVARADLVTFTGTYKNAEQVRAALRADQLFLYFGQGVNPFIVGPDADLDLATTDAIRIRLLNSGQDCFGPDVFFVHQSCFDRFVGLLTKRVDELRFGQYTDPDADYGPMYYDSALGAAAEYLQTHGDHIVSGGRVDFRTRQVQPTVLARPLSAKAPVEDLFSPIFNVMRYDTAIQLRERLGSAFFTERAMGAMVYGDDPGTVDLLAGRHTVCRNATLLDVDNGNEPFGGYGMIANYVAYQGKRIAKPLLISKAVAEHLQGRKVPA
ncbi:aldehyde dehydrogenase family protein [Amycolatopsis sp. NPDC059021]|uniref:aldehyde dehydrogenase family protein n=1 Tax=Amycolatopsis sp. NPDC059021 TaxID=3346704 RepID=UPI00366AD4E1